jgi:hypothetical protein
VENLLTHALTTNHSSDLERGVGVVVKNKQPKVVNFTGCRDVARTKLAQVESSRGGGRLVM